MATQKTLRLSGDAGLLQLSAIGWVVHAVIQCALGAVLGLSYKASASEAHLSVAGMHDGSWQRIAQGFHYWGSAILILHAIGQLVATIFLGRYGKQDRWGVIAVMIMIGVSLGFQITGNLLPFDHHAVQTAAIENGIANRAPVVGRMVANIAFSGNGVTVGTLPQWYAFHRLLPFGVLLVGWLSWIWVRGGIRYYLKPLAFAPTLLALILGIAVASPFGGAATVEDFTKFDAHASWYTWPAHGALTLFDTLIKGGGWVGAMLIPGLFGAALFASAWAKPSSKWPRFVLGGAIAFFAIATIGWGGAFAPLTGTRDPAVEAVAASTTKQPPIDAKLAATGRKLLNDNCSSCHGTDGKQGEGGPSLAKVNERHSDAAYFMKYIHDPKSVKSSSTMPAFPDLSQSDLQALAEYLRGPH